MAINCNTLTSKGEGTDVLKNMRVAVCGSLDTACNALREEGIYKIDKYSDALELTAKLSSGEEYHMILVYAPQGEGLDMYFPYKINLAGDLKSVPVRLLNEPACHSALVELKIALRYIAKETAQQQCRVHN